MKKILVIAMTFVFSISLYVFADDAATSTEKSRPTDTKGYERSTEVNKGKQGEAMKAKNAEKREEKKAAKGEAKAAKKETREAKKDAKKDAKKGE